MTDLEKAAQELQRCKESPWYFMTNYMMVDGKLFTTPMSEERFNEMFRVLQNEQEIQKMTVISRALRKYRQ